MTAPKIPLCKICDVRHPLGTRHTFKVGRSGSSVTVVTQDVTIPYVKARSVTPIVTEQQLITAAVTESHECPICGLLHHRPKTTAERSKAYRGRKA